MEVKDSKQIPQTETKPLRFRVPNEHYKALRIYAVENGYMTGRLAAAIMGEWIEKNILEPKRKEEVDWENPEQF